MASLPLRFDFRAQLNMKATEIQKLEQFALALQATLANHQAQAAQQQEALETLTHLTLFKQSKHTYTICHLPYILLPPPAAATTLLSSGAIPSQCLPSYGI
eukprot:505513-Pelagomonas_calceolata.AAC.1